MAEGRRRVMLSALADPTVEQRHASLAKVNSQDTDNY
jgi:hypothetical protein